MVRRDEDGNTRSNAPSIHIIAWRRRFSETKRLRGGKVSSPPKIPVPHTAGALSAWPAARGRSSRRPVGMSPAIDVSASPTCRSTTSIAGDWYSARSCSPTTRVWSWAVNRARSAGVAATSAAVRSGAHWRYTPAWSKAPVRRRTCASPTSFRRSTTTSYGDRPPKQTRRSSGSSSCASARAVAMSTTRAAMPSAAAHTSPSQRYDSVISPVASGSSAGSARSSSSSESLSTRPPPLRRR
jgi:hypothetical protein